MCAERLVGGRLAGVLVALACAGLLCTCSAAVIEPDGTEESPELPGGSAARDHPMPKAAFGLWYGSGCAENGKCGCGTAKDLAAEFNCQMDRLTASDIPVSVYLFDGSAWSRGKSTSQNTCSGADCCVWKLGDQVKQRLVQTKVKALLHFWGGCHDAVQYRRAQDALGTSLLGFYLDDGSSDDNLLRVAAHMQATSAVAWDNVAKAYQNREPSTTTSGLAFWANVAYVGDLDNDFSGLAVGSDRILSIAPHLPAPMNEFTGYAFGQETIPSEEVYARRLHFGAFQPVMAHTPFANCDPWRSDYSPALLPIYRYYAWLHKELIPYFYSHAYRMHENTEAPVLRAGPMPGSFRVGDELYVALVTTPTVSMRVTLPPGQWIDYWNETRTLSGTVSFYSVPLGHEPIFIRRGAIIPMDVQRDVTGHGTDGSKGSLTVLVYPFGTSTFSYRSEAYSSWITFTSQQSGNRITLTTTPGPPSIPIIYRIGQRSSTPTSVRFLPGQVAVNQGGGIPPLAGEAEVNASTSNAWYYDAAARRLIAKIFP